MANCYTKRHRYPKTCQQNDYRAFDQSHPLATLLNPSVTAWTAGETTSAILGPMKTHERPLQVDILCTRRIQPTLIRTINTEFRRASVWPWFTDDLPYDLFFDRFAYQPHPEGVFGIRPGLDPKPVYKPVECNVGDLIDKMVKIEHVQYPYM